jgi:single-strand DNA-binding protein
MLNQAIVVGRILEKPELRETNDGKQMTNIVLEVKRSFKNDKWEYDTDYIPLYPLE